MSIVLTHSPTSRSHAHTHFLSPTCSHRLRVPFSRAQKEQSPGTPSPAEPLQNRAQRASMGEDAGGGRGSKKRTGGRGRGGKNWEGGMTCDNINVVTEM